MIENAREGRVFQRRERRHVVRVEHEIEHVEVLLHPFTANRLRNRNNVLLHERTQHHLTSSLAVLFAHSFQHSVLEDPVLRLGERRPCLVRHTVLHHHRMRGVLLAERMRLDLVHRRRNLRERAHVDQSLRVEVRDADSANLPRLVRILHRAVRAGIVAHRLVEQHEVDVVGAQAAQAFVDGRRRTLVVHIGNPDLARDEHVLARNAAFAHGGADAFLVAVRLRRVDEAVAHFQRFRNAALRVLRRRLVDAKPEHRHLHTVIEGFVFHGSVLSF